MMQTVSVPTQAQYDGIVQDILNQPGYRHLRMPWTDFIDTARQVIEAWLAGVFSRLFDQPAVTTPFTGGVSVAVILLSAAGFIALVLLTAGLFSGVFRRSSQVTGILGEPITAETTPDTLLEKSRAAERAGDRRQAVRYGFIAVLLKMHRARMVFLDETWTNQELYGYLEKNRLASLPALRGIMEEFNAAWYGHKLPNDAAYAVWQRELEQVWQEVASHEK